MEIQFSKDTGWEGLGQPAGTHTLEWRKGQEWVRVTPFRSRNVREFSTHGLFPWKTWELG